MRLALVVVAAVIGVAGFAPPTLPPQPPRLLEREQQPVVAQQPFRFPKPRLAVESHTVLLEVDSRLRQRKADGANANANAASGVDAGTDQLQSSLPYYSSQAPHEITQSEREYTPEGQLDALAADQQRVLQAAQLERFNQRLDTQILVKQASKLARRTAAVARAPAAPGNVVARDGRVASVEELTPLTSASTANLVRQQRERDARDRNWLGSMRLASARSEQAAANAIRQTAREQQRLNARHHHRHGHRHKHALNLGQRVAQHNRAAGRTAGRNEGRTSHGVHLGAGVREGDDGGDVEDEKYMATDEAKGQEIEYEPDESSNNWWWDYWAPYIA